MQETKDKGKIVTAAGTGINLALGVLYTWSIFKGAIKQSIEQGGAGSFAWDLNSLNDPYAVCCLVFAFTMILAGKCQDKFGPRVTALTGGVLVGLGFIWISQTTAYINWVLGFGVLVGAGIAFGYSSATPPAMKWFPPTKSGLIAGVVVSGFGLASVYIAPLAKYLLIHYGLSSSMLFFGIAFAIIVGTLSMFLSNPPEGFVPKGFVDRRAKCKVGEKSRTAFVDKNMSPGEMVKTPTFWIVWLLYFIGAGAGLMVIGSVAGMAKKSLGTNAFMAVAFLAVGNAAGRVVAGILSDKVGKIQTMATMFVFQALLMFAAVKVIGAESENVAYLVLLTTFIGFNYGANLAIFPLFTKDYWGFKNFGVNYGIVFTAWGVGGFVMSKVSQAMVTADNSFSSSFMVSGMILLFGAGLTYLLKDEKAALRKKVAKEMAAVATKSP